MLIGTLAISGIPLFSGFFSKDKILWSAQFSIWQPSTLVSVFYPGLTSFTCSTIYLTSRGFPGSLQSQFMNLRQHGQR